MKGNGPVVQWQC